MPSPNAFIIPALNEEAALAPMLDGLRHALDAAACADADMVVVDNGSRDRDADQGAPRRIARAGNSRELPEPNRGRVQNLRQPRRDDLRRMENSMDPSKVWTAFQPAGLTRVHNFSPADKRKSNSQLTSV